VAGDPIAARAAGEEARDLADVIGDRVGSRQCRVCLGWSQLWQGDLAGAAAEFGALAADAGATHDGIIEANSLAGRCYALAWQGDIAAARATADAALQSASELGAVYVGVAHMAVGQAALAAGDHAAAARASEAAWQHLSVVPGSAAAPRALSAEATLASGDLGAARRLVDEAVTIASGWQLVVALTTRARVAIAQGEPEQGECDAHDALAIAANMQAYLGISDILEPHPRLHQTRPHLPRATRPRGSPARLNAPCRSGCSANRFASVPHMTDISGHRQRCPAHESRRYQSHDP